MEITLLPDKRKATFIAQVTDKMAKIRLEDGREAMWPIDKIQQPPTEGEETLKLVKIPAIDRLKELKSEKDWLTENYISLTGDDLFKFNKLVNELRDEAKQEFKAKWGLT